MIYTSLAVAVMTASAAVSPLSNLFHFHPHAAQPDARISVTLLNKTMSFRDVEVDGHTYTIDSHRCLLIKAPAGTAVYAASATPKLKRGDLMLEVTPQLNGTQVEVN